MLVKIKYSNDTIKVFSIDDEISNQNEMSPEFVSMAGLLVAIKSGGIWTLEDGSTKIDGRKYNKIKSLEDN